MSVATNTGKPETSTKQNGCWDDWIAEVDTFGAFPPPEHIPDLLARCPDPSRPEAILLAQDLKKAV